MRVPTAEPQKIFTFPSFDFLSGIVNLADYDFKLTTMALLREEQILGRQSCFARVEKDLGTYVEFEASIRGVKCLTSINLPVELLFGRKWRSGEAREYRQFGLERLHAC